MEPFPIVQFAAFSVPAAPKGKDGDNASEAGRERICLPALGLSE